MAIDGPRPAFDRQARGWWRGWVYTRPVSDRRCVGMARQRDHGVPISWGLGAIGFALTMWGCTPLNGGMGASDGSKSDAAPDTISDVTLDATTGGEAPDGVVDAVGEASVDARLGDAGVGDASLVDAGIDSSISVDGGTDMGAAGDAARDASVGVDAIQDRPADTVFDLPMDVVDAPTDAVGCGRYVRGPTMVSVPNGCIDSTEVTQAQYQAFLVAKNGDMSGQGPECSWNQAYAAALMCFPDPVGHPNFPINGVDWCDATAYCRWAGKRLCGHVGGGALIETMNFPPTTGSMQPDLSRPDISEWTAACSRGGLRAYPYGGSLVPESCNVGEHSGTPRAIVDVKTTAGCEGGYASVFDMVGNVHEWENACEPINPAAPGPNDRCFIRGGSYHDLGYDCTSANPLARNWVDNLCDMGIRCCADP
jgi:sulfatase modifying factor 1